MCGQPVQLLYINYSPSEYESTLRVAVRSQYLALHVRFESAMNFHILLIFFHLVDHYVTRCCTNKMTFRIVISHSTTSTALFSDTKYFLLINSNGFLIKTTLVTFWQFFWEEEAERERESRVVLEWKRDVHKKPICPAATSLACWKVETALRELHTCDLGISVSVTSFLLLLLLSTSNNWHFNRSLLQFGPFRFRVSCSLFPACYIMYYRSNLWQCGQTLGLSTIPFYSFKGNCSVYFFFINSTCKVMCKTLFSVECGFFHPVSW